MKRKIASKIVVLSVLLALVFSAVGTTPAQAAGLYTHTWFVESAIDRLEDQGGYTELVDILNDYPSWVNFGSIFPDITIKVDDDWAEILHDTVDARSNYNEYLKFLKIYYPADLKDIEVQTDHYKEFLDNPEFNSMIPRFRAALIRQMMMVYFKHIPRTPDDEKMIAFLFGLIAHQEADVPWHLNLPDCNDRYYLGIGWGLECAAKEKGYTGELREAQLDHILYDFGGDSGHEVSFDFLGSVEKDVRDACTAAGERQPKFSLNINFLEDLWALRLLVGTGSDNPGMKDWLMTYVPGGIEYGSALIAATWMQTWDLMSGAMIDANIYYVTSTGTGGCLSWANACNLRYALNHSFPGQEIWVAEGTYKPTDVATDRTATFQLRGGVAVYGGFTGAETAREQRDPVAHLTILSGDIDNNDSQTPITDLRTVTGNTTNSYHVVVGENSAILDGFTITAGNANDSAQPNNMGGGMYNNAIFSSILSNLVFSGNSAQVGGGMYNYYGNSTLTDVIFQNNTATEGNGGGIENFVSSPMITNATFINNTAINGNGGGMHNSSQTICYPYGGGSYCYIYIGYPALINVTFSGNTAKLGGGIDNDISSPTLINVTFNGNTATTPDGGGSGSMHNKSQYTCMSWILGICSGYDWQVSAPIVLNSILWGNSSGEIYNEGNPPDRTQISNSVVQGGCPNGSTCTNLITADPKLGTIGEYGGFTPTIPLTWGSPAIDAGDDDTCPATDQRGVARPQGAHCDIGAVEMLLSEIDTIPPSITGAATTLPNIHDWYNTDVTVHFTADDAESGVDTVTPDQLLTEDGAGQFVTGTAVDLAGNSASFTVGPINIDKTPPSISGAATTLPNGNGWYNTDVTIHFDAEDQLSGLESLTPDQTLTSEGAGQSATGTAVDLAGNSASITVEPINIDKTPPVVAVSVDKDRYTKTETFTVHFTGSDALSGLNSLTAEFNGQSVTDGQVVDLFWLPLGTHTLTVRAEDLAGNVTEVSQSIELVASLESMKETVARLCTEGYVTKGSTCNELSAKLNAAIAAHNRGNNKAATNLLKAFQNAVKAQMNKAIQESAAQLLLLDSAYLVDELSR